jgi:ABC-2 type transport system ATP-binding protein
MSDFIVQSHQLTKTYAGKRVLNDFSIQLEPGLVHGIVGNNGAGKSTLLQILLGLVGADSGTAKLMGCDSRNIDLATRAKIGYLNADYPLPSHLTIGQLGRLQAAHFTGWDQPLFEQIIDALSLTTQQRTSQLARGEKTRLNMALVLAQKPELLILDEPTAGLDISSQQFMFDTLLDNHFFDRHSVLYCTHRAEELERFADNIVVINNGNLVTQGEVSDIVGQVDIWRVTLPEGSDCESQTPQLLSTRLIDGVYYLSVNAVAGDLSGFFKEQGATDVQKITPRFAQAVGALTSQPAFNKNGSSKGSTAS